MRFDVLTLFPSMIPTPVPEGVLGRAFQKNVLSLHVHDLREFAEGPHRVTDDYPFGGGEGMILKVEPLVRGIEALQGSGERGHVVLMTPQGVLFHQGHARRLAQMRRLILVCGRYEGVDERVSLGGWVDEELSIGDYILTGGELAAMVVIEVVGRLVPGVVGCEESLARESFEETGLKHPQFTRPAEFRGLRVPEVLLSGHHERIRRWRRQQVLKRTWLRRPDLFARMVLSEEDRRLFEEIRDEIQKE